jgi:nicotinate-nucleotide pyrophosphorylase (carboxylating)
MVSSAEVMLSGFVYQEIDQLVHTTQLVADGNPVKTGDVVMTFQGPTISPFNWRTNRLNFAQRMSGVATKTSAIAALVQGTSISILDTRKTLPGFRMLDKYAVRKGGGKNHRIGLFDMVLIKDNHIKAAGSISAAVSKVRERWGDKFKIEVETTSLDEVREALSNNPDIIMLDNMDKSTMAEAITIVAGKAEIELSGNMDEEKIRNLRDLKM